MYVYILGEFTKTPFIFTVYKTINDFTINRNDVYYKTFRGFKITITPSCFVVNYNNTIYLGVLFTKTPTIAGIAGAPR